jgi:hypothetical protein
MIFQALGKVILSKAKDLEFRKQMLRFPSLRSGRALSMTQVL